MSKLATIFDSRGRTTAAQVHDDGSFTGLPFDDVGALIREGSVGTATSKAAGRQRIAAADVVRLAPPIATPGKIICVGHNYRAHIAELGQTLPEHPNLFTKFGSCLIGPTDEIRLPVESHAMDWEAEVVVVIGRSVRRASDRAASDAIAGYMLGTDITARDWQHHASQWLAGKAWDQSTPVGPWLTTADELGVLPEIDLRATVNGVQVQQANTNDLVFGVVPLVRYITTFTTLEPGDLIFTGTPSGVGAAATPPQYLRPGDEVTTSSHLLGTLRNLCVSAD